MPLDSPSSGDRRPIASRNLIFFQNLALWLVRKKVSANVISILGMVAAIAAAAALIATGAASPLDQRLLLLTAAAGIQLRLLANMLDGMVALLAGAATPAGELFNEIPDRMSDTVLLVGAGYAAGGMPLLGWLAACLALFVTYIRTLGKTLGVVNLFHGPMSKSHRMFTLTIACLYLGLAPAAWQPSWPIWEGTWPPPFPLPPGHSIGLLSAALAVVILGAIVTAFRRVLCIAKSPRRTGEARRHEEQEDSRRN